MSDRGVIRSIKYARQRADFNGMLFGTITPTDIDGFVEFSDQVFVFIETKHGDAKLPRGQRLALERVCDRVQKSGAQAMVLVLHNNELGNGSATYQIAPLPVTQYRYKGEWFRPRDTINALQAVQKFKSKFIAESQPKVVDPRLQSNDEWLRDYEEAYSV
jgi:hypothetical protein